LGNHRNLLGIHYYYGANPVLDLRIEIKGIRGRLYRDVVIAAQPSLECRQAVRSQSKGLQLALLLLCEETNHNVGLVEIDPDVTPLFTSEKNLPEASEKARVRCIATLLFRLLRPMPCVG
jgi:hypothetical protein